MTRPAELIISFFCQTGMGYVWTTAEPAVTLQIGRSDEQCIPSSPFGPSTPA